MQRYQTIHRPKNTLLLGPATLAADNTPTAIDLQDFMHAELEIFTGVGGITFDATNKLEWKLRHGDTSTVADHTAVAAADVILPSGVTLGSGGIVWALVAAHAAAAMRVVEYVGSKRYLSLLADFGGTHGTGTILAAKARLSGGRHNPPL